jgi:hypothetical protein
VCCLPRCPAAACLAPSCGLPHHPPSHHHQPPPAAGRGGAGAPSGLRWGLAAGRRPGPHLCSAPPPPHKTPPPPTRPPPPPPPQPLAG